MTSASADYSADWVSGAGLNLEPGYCITIVRAVQPRTALHQLGVSDADIRTAPWSELVAQVSELKPPYRHIVTAAFVIGEHTVLVEENGYRGHLAEWSGPLSRGTEVVSVYLSPSNGNQDLSIYRNGERLAFIDGDAPEDVDTNDKGLNTELPRLIHAALKPWDEDGLVPKDFDDGRVDLLQVACDYLGLRPRVSDISAPALGAPVRL